MKMNSLEFSLVFLILVPHSIWFGCCDEVSFSICWMSRENVLDRQNGNLWLNITSLKTIGTVGKVTSLTVSPLVEHKLRLRYGGSVQEWTLTIIPRTKFTKVTGRQKPLRHPTNSTRVLLESLGPTEVFACENGTLFFHQDDNFFLAFGHTMRFPVKLESRSPSTLLVSWVENHPDVIHSHRVTLYHTDLGSYTTDTTTLNYHHFSALNSCSHYVACVEIAGTHSFTCISTITDPDVPEDFEVTMWNSSSISLAWECPMNHRYSLFLLTTFYLNGTDHITEELKLWLSDNTFAFSLSDLQPCSKVKFGLQAVCQAGIESRYSKMVLSDGNSVHSSIEDFRQTSFGPNNYTLSWEVRNTSSISMFRVYHEGSLQGTTLITSYTVGGLLPCHEYQAKVEALCGESVVMSTKTITAHTGPQGVSELRYRSYDSTALWTPSTLQLPDLAFIYELSPEDGPSIQSSRVTTTELHLPGLEEDKTYILHVWEECNSQWESEPSRLYFKGANSSLGQLARAPGSTHESDLQEDFDRVGLVAVPWSLPKDLQDGASEPRAKMRELFKNKLQELLEDFEKPVRIELATFQPADEPNKTEILFMSFDASESEDKAPLPIEDQLNYISSLNRTNITVKEGVIHWDGPDLCASNQTVCPHHSLCINTLGSYSCICQHGYYDVSLVVEPPAASRPVCKEKGLFSQCLNKVMTGGIAKPYLTSHIGGKVEVRLNDGRCFVNESETLYFFRTSRRPSECGTERQVNKTHIKFQNTLTVTLTREQTISRRDLKVVWKCIYPRHYVRNAHVSVDREWFSSISLVEFNSSLQLGLTMTLYEDESYTSSYRDAIFLGPEETLFFQVALQLNSSFASDVLLQVDSCWATESTDPEDTIQAVLFEESCPVDSTFQWLSVNGLAQKSRFSIHMFSMPQRLPLYFHCLANICGHDENCTKNCTSQQRARRSASHMDRKERRAAVVSAGPLVVSPEGKSGQPSYWAEHITVLFIVVGAVGFLGVTVLSVTATKAIMTYFEQLRQ